MSEAASLERPASPVASAVLSRRLVSTALSDALDIAPEHAEVIYALWRGGEPISMVDLRWAISRHRPPSAGVLYERIRLLRERFGRDFIAGFKSAAERQGQDPTHVGRLGRTEYWLSEVGEARCRAALLTLAGSLANYRAPLRTAPTPAN